MSQQKPWLAKLLSFLLVVGIGLGSAAAAFYYRQPLVDTVLAWQYEPSAAEQSIRKDLDLTDIGKRYYDASRTTLQTSDEFNQSCQQQKETNNPILGCYYLQKIYVYDIDNDKLSGIEQTTAAHEVLHAAYERMSMSERESTDKELQRVYASVQNDELKERMQYYEKAEPGEEMNELHSILGTEFRTLSEPLEKHYAKYFNDRAKVVSYFDKYNAVFTSVLGKLKSQLEEINSSISKVNNEIDSYNKARKQLESDIRAYQNNTYTSQAESNRDFQALKAREADVNGRVSTINAQIARINQLKQSRNKLVKEYNSLNQSINSSVSPTPSL